MRSSKILPSNLIYLTILLFIASCGEQVKTDSQTEKLPSPDTLVTSAAPTDSLKKVPGSIEEIQKAYAVITQELESDRLDSVSFKYNCNNEKQGTVTYYSDNGQLLMIVHRYHEYDHYSAVDRYFVKDSKLFFASLNSIYWSFDNGPQGATKDDITERRTYLVNQEPVKCLEKKYTIRSKEKNNPSSETVPNKSIECGSSKPVLKQYKLLVKYLHEAPSGCLD